MVFAKQQLQLSKMLSHGRLFEIIAFILSM